MAKIPVQLLFTEDEYAKLQVKANEHGLTVPLYIKSEVVQGDDFGTYYRTLLEKVESLRSSNQPMCSYVNRDTI